MPCRASPASVSPVSHWPRRPKRGSLSCLAAAVLRFLAGDGRTRASRPKSVEGTGPEAEDRPKHAGDDAVLNRAEDAAVREDADDGPVRQPEESPAGDIAPGHHGDTLDQAADPLLAAPGRREHEFDQFEDPETSRSIPALDWFWCFHD